MTRKELKALLGEGKIVTIRKDEKGYVVTDITDQVTYKEESAALEVLVDSPFEYGDVLFDPNGPPGPSLIINNEPSTEISLTKKPAEALLNVGIPCFADAEETPSFDDLLNATTTDNTRLLMEKIRDAGEEKNFVEAIRQLAPLVGKAPSLEDMCGGKVK